LSDGVKFGCVGLFRGVIFCLPLVFRSV
jgi:hypothetical protein